MSRYFEDFRLGETFITPRRTVAESDIVNFAGLSGDYHPLHTDDEYAKGTRFGGRIAQGLLTLSVVSGLWLRLGIYGDPADDTLLAFYGMDGLRFTAPVRPGDTIGAKLKVVKKQERGKDGLITFLNEVVNQDRKVVLTFTAHFLFKRRIG